MALKKKSRLNGEGTIFDKTVKKKRKNGEEYELKYVEAQIMINGKRESKTFRAKKDASAWLLEKRDEVSKGTHIESNKIKFKEYAETWLNDKIREGKKNTTITGWKLYLDKHILPSLGNTVLKDITTVMINKFYDEKLGVKSKKKQDSKVEEKKNEPISPNTVIHFHRIIHNILNHAVKQRLLSYNPASACSKPKAVKPTINILTVEEAIKIIEVARQHNIKKNGEINKSINPSYYPALLVDIYTGLRRSELMGLKWEYVDLEKGIITIAETLLQGTDNKIYQDDDTKTYAGKRTISIPSEVVEVLRQHKEYMGKTEYVFCNRNGERPDPHNFNRFFEKLLVKAGITKHVRVHDLRHSYATMSLKNGDSIKDVQANLGHSSATITLDLYAHVTTEMKQASADRMDAFILGVCNAK